jgi:elongation factor 1-beta
VENAESSVVPINVQNAGLQAHKAITGERAKMGNVIITYKIFPTDVVESFDELKKNIEAIMPEFSSISGTGEEPIAFGLKALLLQVKFPEDQTGILDDFEKKLENVEGVSQVQTLMVRRTSR